MMAAFDENSKHSFAKCELVRILSTTITRSNTEFAKLSFDNIYDPVSYINECYTHLWKEWADDKINSNDILRDGNRWDEWMINYYTQCRQDYFNSICEMFTLMQFHTQALQADFSWIYKKENLQFIIDHDGMVSTKLVNKLDYLLKKHNFGSLELQPKAQKYRTRKRGGCKMCNQIRDVKRMLEKQINGSDSDNDSNNNNNNNNNNNKKGGKKGRKNNDNNNKSAKNNKNKKNSIKDNSSSHSSNNSIVDDNNSNPWKTTEVSSQGSASNESSNFTGITNITGTTTAVAEITGMQLRNPNATRLTHNNLNMLLNNNNNNGYYNHNSSNHNGSVISSKISSDDNNNSNNNSNNNKFALKTVSKTLSSNISNNSNNNDSGSDSEQYNLVGAIETIDAIDTIESVSVSCSDSDISKLLLLTPTPPPPGVIEMMESDLDTLLSIVGVPDAETVNDTSLFPASMDTIDGNNLSKTSPKSSVKSTAASLHSAAHSSHSSHSNSNTVSSNGNSSHSHSNAHSSHCCASHDSGSDCKDHSNEYLETVAATLSQADERELQLLHASEFVPQAATAATAPKMQQQLSYMYDIHKLYYNTNSLLRQNSHNGSETAVFDPTIKERHFDVVNINQCQYGTVYDFDKPTVLCDINENSYFYYIPREYACNIKTVTQFKLAIENLTNWDQKFLINTKDNAWYTHDGFGINYEHGKNNANNNNNNDNNEISIRNSYPDWLRAIEVKVLSMLDKFAQLSDIVQGNSPNSCLIRKFEDGNQFEELHNQNGKYFDTLNEQYGSITMSLGATRVLAIGSLLRNHCFGVNLKYGDLFVMAGQFECCYEYGIPMQSLQSQNNISSLNNMMNNNNINNNNFNGKRRGKGNGKFNAKFNAKLNAKLNACENDSSSMLLTFAKVSNYFQQM